MRFLGVSDGNMAEGSLRCDVNVSVRPRGASKLGTKVNKTLLRRMTAHMRDSRRLAALPRLR